MYICIHRSLHKLLMMITVYKCSLVQVTDSNYSIISFSCPSCWLWLWYIHICSLVQVTPDDYGICPLVQVTDERSQYIKDHQWFIIVNHNGSPTCALYPWRMAHTLVQMLSQLVKDHISLHEKAKEEGMKQNSQNGHLTLTSILTDYVAFYEECSLWWKTVFSYIRNHSSKEMKQKCVKFTKLAVWPWLLTSIIT